MSVKIPLVLAADGRPEQLQSGDTVASSGVATETLTPASNMNAGGAVYCSGASASTKARANGSPQAFAVGLCQAAQTSGVAGAVQVNGVLTLSTANWDTVTGGSGGLTAGSTYYLDPTTAGNLTATCPTAAGQYVVIMGRAMNTTDMLITPREPILL